MTSAECTEIDTIVRKALQVTPNQTIKARALDLLRMPRRRRTPLRVLRACELLLSESTYQWGQMARAAKLLAPLVRR